MNNLSAEIIKEWGLESLSPEKQTDFAERIAKMLYQAVLVRTLDLLGEQDQTEFDLLLDEDTTTPEDVLAFLSRKIPTLDQILSEEKQKLKSEILEIKE